MPHSPLSTAGTKYIAIPPSFFAQAGQSRRSSRLPSVQPDPPSPIRISVASQQAARLAQQRATKQKKAMTQGTNFTCESSSEKVAWMTSSTRSTTFPQSNPASASSTSPSVFSSSSETSQDFRQTIKTLRNIEDLLDDLLSNFQAPDYLDFRYTRQDPQYLYRNSQNGPLTHLSVTSHNFPVIALGKLLKLLEQKAGFVEAHGNKYIEVRRKNVANRIQEATAYLEKLVCDLWRIACSKQI